MKSIAARKRQLQARLGELDARFQHIETELESHQGVTDWEDQATEHEEDEVLEGIGRSGQQEVARIFAALKRIETGEYGHCTQCGERIGEERLDLLPDTPFCRNCAP
jgi:RNA polymerase-binding transcription factor DksA